MKRHVLLLLILFPLVVNAQCYCGYHTECYEGQQLILKGLEWLGAPEFCHNLFMDFDEVKGKLKKPIKLKNTKQYLGSKVTISRVIKDVNYDEKYGSVFVLENNTWGKLYYFYRPSQSWEGWDNEKHFQFEGDIYCKAYYDDQISKKIDKFEGVTTYFTPKIESRFVEGVRGFKSIIDSIIIYSILFEVVCDYYSLPTTGIYVILGDGSQLRDESVTISVNKDEYGYHYSALLPLTNADYERICVNGIDAFKVGRMEAREIKADRKEYIRRYLNSLL